MTLESALLGVAGLVLLVGGAELLVRGAAAIASRFGISPLIIGLTVVAFGTSAPEFAVSVRAAADAAGSDVALGNVVGSNIVNVLFILGLSALAGGLTVALGIIRRDVPILIGISVVTLLLALDGSFGRIDGIIFFVSFVGYTLWIIRAAKRERAEAKASYEAEISELEGLTGQRPVIVNAGFVVLGLVLLVVGAQFLVSAATSIAQDLGVSDLVIGLTIVAVGTSLPELATSMLAAIRGERDIAVGNVVGSNIFNLLCVLGLSAIVAPTGLGVASGARSLDLPVMIAAAFVLLPVCWHGLRVDRWEGAVFIGAYIAYVAYLILTATDHPAATVLAPAALVVTPLMLVTFSVLGIQGWRRYREEHAKVALEPKP